MEIIAVALVHEGRIVYVIMYMAEFKGISKLFQP